jgi:ssDNA-binding Zn-finger/Zn-ribbon topoisomerase 1
MSKRVESRVDCPGCGKPMLRRSGKFGPFWGCVMYPKCVTTMKDRDVAAMLVGERPPGIFVGEGILGYWAEEGDMMPDLGDK